MNRRSRPGEGGRGDAEAAKADASRASADAASAAAGSDAAGADAADAEAAIAAAEQALALAESALEALRLLDDATLWRVRWRDLEDRVARSARALDRALAGAGPHALGGLEFRLANLVRALAISAPPSVLEGRSRTRRRPRWRM